MRGPAAALVAQRYIDALGHEREVPVSTRETFVALLAAESDDAIAPASLVLRDGAAVVVPVTVPASSWTAGYGYTIVREDGTTEHGDGRLRDAPVLSWSQTLDTTFDVRGIPLPALPFGYHRVDVAIDGGARATTTVVVVPRAVHAEHERVWGIAVQLYTLRSARNWGVGDFGDLGTICRIAAGAGATYVGLNPLHAAHRADPEAASPYAPSSRVWLNWLAIDVEALPEARDPSVQALIAAPAFAQRLAALRATPLVDYAGVAAVKREALERCVRALGAQRRAAFEAWRDAQGAPLRRFTTFEVLVERFGRDVTAWPATFRDPASEAVGAFAAAERDAIEFGAYLQWCAAEQLHAVASEAAAHGVRLYRDLAVGVESAGADAWAEPAAYVTIASVGAPPDLLNTKGQDWGLPPTDPRGLARDGYRAWAELVRANVRDAGALRIDHAMSLARLFWIPRGVEATDGTYVRYPLDDLLGVLALESTRARCVVIGEDLGTVPPGFREAMADAEVLSYRILFFERSDDGGFIAPDRYPERALAATGTHDLPPMLAWLRGDDVPIRASLGLVDADAARDERARERARLVETLVSSGDLDASRRSDEWAITLAAHRFLARTPSRIAMFQLDDALGETAPVNVPGTSTEYPNWRRKLRLDLESIATDGRFRELCNLMGNERPR